MKTEFSKTWKSSTQPRKQRKYRANAKLHTKTNFLTANLSKELRKKHDKRNAKLRKGDKVKILRGNFKGKDGKVEEIDHKTLKVYITKIEITKKDGSKVRVPQNASNLQITELDLTDKKRKAKLNQRSGKHGSESSTQTAAKQGSDSRTQNTDTGAK